MKPKKIVLMGYSIQDYLLKHKIQEAKPRELTEYLVEKGSLTKDHREGLPLRKVLRELDAENKLYLVPQARVKRKNKNRFWFFNAVEI